MKPAKEAFEHVIHITGYLPEDIFYFDDNHENVAAATDLGFQAYRVSGVDGVMTFLRNLKIQV
jgi:HAD superfamily hydrolase (TIGR01509 family)